jgi:hypothetical protein
MKTRSIALLVLSMAVVALLTALLVVTTAGAQPAGRNAAALQVAYPMTYQGRLTDNLGNPIANQTRNITFRIYEQPSGGTAVWEQVRAVQTDSGGLFTTVLEVDAPLGVADLSNVWFGIEVGSDGEMTPRQRVGGAPFAFTLVPGNGVTGTVDLGTWPSAIFGVFNTGTGHGLLARTDGEGVGMLGSSQAGFGGYFTSQEGHALAVNGPILFNTNLKRVALHRWYEANEAHITFSVGGQPKGILFDGGSQTALWSLPTRWALTPWAWPSMGGGCGWPIAVTTPSLAWSPPLGHRLAPPSPLARTPTTCASMAATCGWSTMGATA